ncbi:MAG TPA: DUF1499 domain-containing protein [Caulifigura sp.]|jgi:uncharacterized protein (DUF1499 family)|nr:DUF1499 domain-containing protein [Caulifigura sp.]
MNGEPQFLRRTPMSPARKWLLRSLLLAAVFLSPFLATWNQPRPELGASLKGLKPCPQEPNCVCSDFSIVRMKNLMQVLSEGRAMTPPNYVAPLQLPGDEVQGWKALQEMVGRRPGVTVVESDDFYLRVERRTTIYGLVDDVEFLRIFTGMVLVRSAARVAYADFGRNRSFVESLRAELAKGR